MALKLTLRRIEEAKPTTKPVELRDGEIGGLLLRIQPSGVRTFYLELKRGARVKLGRYPVMTLDGARTQAKARIGDFAKTGQLPTKKAQKADTLGTFIDDHYEPWVTEAHKAGKATVANLKAQFANFLDKPMTAISTFGLEKFKADRLKDGISPATVNRDLARLSGCLTKAIEWKMLAEHPVRGVKPANGGDEHRIRYLSTVEEKALRDALDEREAVHRKRRMSGNAWRAARGKEERPALPAYFDHLTPMTLVALNTGLRRGELTSLTWNDVNLERKVLTVRAGYAKSGKARHIPLNSEAIDVLKRYNKQHKEGRLFAVDSIKKGWAALVTKAKLSDFRWHDLRHTFASKLVMAGVDLNTVRELLGHADIRMTLRYAHLAPEHKAAAVERLVR
jgi:integrase